MTIKILFISSIHLSISLIKILKSDIFYCIRSTSYFFVKDNNDFYFNFSIFFSCIYYRIIKKIISTCNSLFFFLYINFFFVQVDPLTVKWCAILHNNRAAAYLSDGHLKECLSDCNEAILKDQNYSKAYLRRARVYRVSG